MKVIADSKAGPTDSSSNKAIYSVETFESYYNYKVLTVSFGANSTEQSLAGKIHIFMITIIVAMLLWVLLDLVYWTVVKKGPISEEYLLILFVLTGISAILLGGLLWAVLKIVSRKRK